MLYWPVHPPQSTLLLYKSITWVPSVRMTMVARRCNIWRIWIEMPFRGSCWNDWPCQSCFHTLKRQILTLSCKFLWLDICCSAAFKTHCWLLFPLKLSINPYQRVGKKKHTLIGRLITVKNINKHSKPKKKKKQEKEIMIHLFCEDLKKANLTQKKF